MSSMSQQELDACIDEAIVPVDELHYHLFTTDVRLTDAERQALTTDKTQVSIAGEAFTNLRATRLIDGIGALLLRSQFDGITAVMSVMHDGSLAQQAQGHPTPQHADQAAVYGQTTEDRLFGLLALEAFRGVATVLAVARAQRLQLPASPELTGLRQILADSGMYNPANDSFLISQPGGLLEVHRSIVARRTSNQP